MDKKLIQQYGEDIRCYRLRTARQKKRMQYEDFEKQLIALDKEEHIIRSQIKNLGWKELYRPVQKGWIRHFVLREDVANSNQADFFEGILKKINTYEYHWRKDFKIKRRSCGKKIYVVTEQALLNFREYRFWELNFTDEERKFFTTEWYFDFKTGFYKRIVFTEPWRFELKIKANLIYKEPIKDGELESRKDCLQNYLDQNNLRGKQTRLLRGHYKWRGKKEIEKHQEVNQFKNKTLIKIMDLIKHH